MKHLKSSLRDLRQMIDQAVCVKYLTEPILSFDAERSACETRLFMETRDFDIVGVREAGHVVGYVCREELNDGQIRDYLKEFDDRFLLEDAMPMLHALKLLVATRQVFVITLGRVSGIITKGDLQKPPMRMWLFSIVSLLEMQLLRLIKARHPRESWKSLLNGNRLEKAQQILTGRKSRNEAIDLADCLQLADKRTVILKTDGLWQQLGFTSKSACEAQLAEIELLRDELAHSQDIISGRWPQLVELAENTERLLAACEELEKLGGLRL